MKFNTSQFRLFLRFLRLIFPHYGKWTLILLLSAITSLLALVNPYLVSLVIDKAIGNNDLRLFIALSILGIIVFVIGGIMDGFQEYLARSIRLKVRFSLSKKVFTHINSLSFSWFQNKSTGENLYKVNYDIDRVTDLVTTVPPKAVSLLIKIPVIFFIILRFNWKMAVLSLVLAPFLYVAPFYFINKRKKVWERLIKNSEGVFKFLQESFSHSYIIKSFGKETSEARKYLRQLINNIRIELGSIRLEILNSFFSKVIDKLIIGLIVLYGGYQVIKARMTLGSLTAILAYLGQLVSMQSLFVVFFQTTALGLVSCKRVASVLDEKINITEDRNAKRVIFNKGEIVFNNISFGYLKDKAILKNLNFSIKHNKHVSLAASSGAGKTTILNLIVRLYDPWQGEIMIDGFNIRDIALADLKKQIGMVLQEPFLFNDTVKNNICYAREDASESEIIDSSRLSLGHDFIERLPERYDTIIGENACKLSEGEKQRIAIARALIKRPRILIMDEAFNAMDSLSEEKIIANIKRDLKETTIISVSHRLSTTMAADIVYFLNNRGEIIIGPGQELFQNNKEFQGLFRPQKEI